MEALNVISLLHIGIDLLHSNFEQTEDWLTKHRDARETDLQNTVK